MDFTILQQFSEWVSNNFIATAIAGGVTWDVIKSQLWEPFKNQFAKYFKDENVAEKYFYKIGTIESTNKKKPYRDIEDVYEELTDNNTSSEFIEELKKFIIKNKDKIEVINKSKTKEIIINQKAGRDIINVSGGSQTINNVQKEDNK